MASTIFVICLWAHPRSRGENLLRIPASELVKGSSPLTRGKLPDFARCPGKDGLIPAHAGKTLTTNRTRTLGRAHPRSRGENTYYPSGATLREGSSPLTRGKLLVAVVEGGAQGLIPAHAGKTRMR